MNKNSEAVTVETVETVAKQPKRASFTLNSGKGDKAMKLVLLARRLRGDAGETQLITTSLSTKKSQRGCTTKYETFDLAVAALGKLEKDALKNGWTRTERLGGFKAKPDAFSTMPKAVK